MSEKRSERIAELFDAAAAVPAAERSAFLERACAGDAELRREVETLLAHDTGGADAFSDDEIAQRRAVLEQAFQNGADGSTPPGAIGLGTPPPAEVGRFRIIEKIAEGGMGTVYLAEQDHPRRRVALKMIRAGAVSPGLVRRFRLEAEVLGRLQHPGIAQIYGAGEIDVGDSSLPYFAMEHIDGVELRRYVRERKLDVRGRLELIARICDAVHHAHQKGVIHRDLKPENVLVVAEPPATLGAANAEFAELGQPKVLDFGVARATDSDIQMTTMRTDVGQLVGTLTYMSPEQVSGDSRQLDARSDIYALGVILYELLAEQPPFNLRRLSVPDAIRVICEEEPTRLGSIHTAFRGDIDTIVCKALEKERQRRYQSAAEFAADIRRCLARQPISAHPPSTFYQLRKFAARNRGLVAGLLASFVILIVGAATSLVFALRAARGEALAKANEQRAVLSEAASLRANYRFNVAAADALVDSDPLQAAQYLEAAPPQYRGWEWNRLQARINAHVTELTGDSPSGGCATIALDPNGVLISALTRNGGIQLVDLQTGNVRATFEHSQSLTNPILSPDGSRLAAVSPADQQLLLWNVRSGEQLLTMPLGAADARYARFSPDGALLGLPSPTEGFKLIETATGTLRFQSAPQATNVTRVAFVASGERVIVGERKSGYYHIHVFSTDGTRVLSKMVRDTVDSLACSPDGSLLAVGHRERQITLLDCSTSEPRSVFYGHHEAVVALTFSPDGSLLASRASDGVIRVVDLETGRPLRVLLCGAADALAFSRDNRFLAAGSANQTRLWELDPEARHVMRGHESYVYGVAFSPDGSMLASSAWDNTVRLWNPMTGEPVATLDSEGAYKWLAFTPNGTRLLAHDGRNATSTSMWDPETGNPVRSGRSSSDTVLFAMAADSGSRLRRFGRIVAGGTRFDDDVTSPDRSLLATVSRIDARFSVAILDNLSGAEIVRLGPLQDEILATAFSPDNRCLAACGRSGTVDVWETATGARLATMRGHVGDVFGVCYSPDGTRIASAGNDGAVILWDARMFDQVGVLRGHTSYVYSVAFSPDGKMIASASGDGTVRIWDSIAPTERWRQIQDAHKP